jgi:hypothetical protein
MVTVLLIINETRAGPRPSRQVRHIRVRSEDHILNLIFKLYCQYALLLLLQPGSLLACSIHCALRLAQHHHGGSADLAQVRSGQVPERSSDLTCSVAAPSRTVAPDLEALSQWQPNLKPA